MERKQNKCAAICCNYIFVRCESETIAWNGWYKTRFGHSKDSTPDSRHIIKSSRNEMAAVALAMRGMLVNNLESSALNVSTLRLTTNIGHSAPHGSSIENGQCVRYHQFWSLRMCVYVIDACLHLPRLKLKLSAHVSARMLRVQFK